MSKRSEWLWPVTIIMDRYSGTYSGGQYTAWNCYPEDIPNDVFSNDMACAEFWGINDETNKYIVGKGRTPDDAQNDLFNKIDAQE